MFSFIIGIAFAAVFVQEGNAFSLVQARIFGNGARFAVVRFNFEAATTGIYGCKGTHWHVGADRYRLIIDQYPLYGALKSF